MPINPPASQVGQDLLNMPFADFVKTLALAIAEGQTALDQNSIEVAKTLATTPITLPGIPPSGSPVELPLIALGITPTFYQFSEALVEVKMAITMTIDTSTSGSGSAGLKFKAFSASVNASYSSKYSYKVEGSSLVRVTLAPVPPPKAMQDYIDAFIRASTPPPALTSTTT